MDSISRVRPADAVVSNPAKRRVYGAAALSVLLACAIFTITPVSSNDTFWHIASGRRFLQTGEVPRVDAFTYSCAGRPWVNHEYLAGAIFAAADTMAGIPGVTVFCSLLVVMTSLLFWLTACAGVPRASRLFPLVLCVALFAVLPRLVPRPHLFSLAFAGFTMLVLRDVERGRRRLIWFVPPVLWIWAQLHGGFLLGLGFLVLLGVRLLTVRDARAYALVLAPAPLLLLAGPYGSETFTFPLSLLSAKTFMEYIAEWQPILGGSPLAQPLCHHVGLLLAGSGVVASLWLWRRKDLALTELVWILALTFMVVFLNMRRLLAYPVLAATVPLTQAICRLRAPKALPAWLPLAPLPVLCLFLAYGIPVGGGTYQVVQLGLGPNVPKKALDLAEANGIQGNSYNSYTLGAYITYRLWPHAKTVIDSRNLVYSEAFFLDYQRSLWLDTPFRRQYLAEADFALLVPPSSPELAMPREDLPRGAWPIHHALHDDPHWHLVYFDDTASLFVSDRIHTEKAADLRPYVWLMPHVLGFKVTTIKELTKTLHEARRATAAAPASSTAWFLRGVAAYELALRDQDEYKRLFLESRFALLKAVAIPGRIVPPSTYFFLAETEAELGDHTTALRYLRACLTRDPDYEPARKLLRRWETQMR